MSEKEIHKALEIIKQPITVNCKDYYYFDQENYNNLVSAYDNCLWFIRNFEQINTTVERLQQENQQLKENNQSYQEEMCRSWEKVDKYKSVLDEIREQFKKIKSDLDFEPWSIYKVSGDKLFDLLQILDKVKQ